MEHVKDQLSAYLDKALPAPESSRVEGHLASCPSCRAELEDLRRISKMVSSLPQKDLPPGFLNRLEKRRKEEPAAKEESRSWFPSPLRAAAFAAAGLFVTLTVYHEAKMRMMASTMAASEVQFAADGFRAEMQSSRAAAPPSAGKLADRRAPGQPLGIPDSPAPMEGGLLSQSAPQDEKAQITNEKLHGFLDEEKRRMGIREIIPQGAGAVASGSGGAKDEPVNREEARQIMRQMTAQLAQVNQAKQARTAPAVALGEGAAPRLLSGQSGSVPVGEMDSVSPARSANIQNRMSIAKSDSIDVSVPAAAIAPSVGPVSARARKASAADKAPFLMKAKKGASPWKASWTGVTAGLAGPGGAQIMNPNDWADLWRRLGLAMELPSIDFDKDMAVAVFGAPADPMSRSVQLVSVGEEAGKLRVRYRNIPGRVDPDAGPLAAYHVVIVPKSALPIDFQRVP